MEKGGGIYIGMAGHIRTKFCAYMRIHKAMQLRGNEAVNASFASSLLD